MAGPFFSGEKPAPKPFEKSGNALGVGLSSNGISLRAISGEYSPGPGVLADAAKYGRRVNWGRTLRLARTGDIVRGVPEPHCSKSLYHLASYWSIIGALCFRYRKGFTSPSPDGILSECRLENFNLEAGIKSLAKVRANLNKILGICLMLILLGGLSACKELIEVPGIITAMALLGFPLSSPAARLHKFGTTLRPFANSPSQTNPMLAPFFGNLSTVLLPSTASALNLFGVVARKALL